jgi:hypothetical protein
LLIRAQGPGVTSAAGGTTPSADPTAATPGPEQKLATDLQSVMNDLRASTSPGGHNPTAGQAESHHHHHHHNGGANAAASGSPREDASTTASNGNGAVSQVFAAHVVKALRAYVGGSAPGATAGLTA